MEESITGSVLGTVLGLGGAIAQEVVEIKKQKNAFEHELQMTKERGKIADLETKNKVKVLNVEADIEEMKRLYEHDIAIGQKTGVFMANLRSSVRPVITYTFFALFIILKVWTFYITTQQEVVDLDMLAGLWDSRTNTLFSAIMSYWFGRRSIERNTESFKKRTISGPIT